MDTIQSDDFRRKLRTVLDRVQFKGESIIVMRYAQPAALLTPIERNVVVTDPTAATVAAAEKLAEKPEENPGKTPKAPKKRGKRA